MAQSPSQCPPCFFLPRPASAEPAARAASAVKNPPSSFSGGCTGPVPVAHRRTARRRTHRSSPAGRSSGRNRRRSSCRSLPAAPGQRARPSAPRFCSGQSPPPSPPSPAPAPGQSGRRRPAPSPETSRRRPRPEKPAPAPLPTPRPPVRNRTGGRCSSSVCRATSRRSPRNNLPRSAVSCRTPRGGILKAPSHRARC